MNAQVTKMPQKLSEGEVKEPGTRELKYFWRAAIIGSATALIGVFACCVYDGYTRLHQGACDCAKYGAMVIAAFSHPIVIVGALAGLMVFSIVYMLRRCFRGHSGPGDTKDTPHRSSQ
jgi:hypothetical protein